MDNNKMKFILNDENYLPAIEKIREVWKKTNEEYIVGQNQHKVLEGLPLYNEDDDKDDIQQNIPEKKKRKRKKSGEKQKRKNKKAKNE